MKGELTDEMYDIIYRGGDEAVEVVNGLIREIKAFRETVRDLRARGAGPDPVDYSGLDAMHIPAEVLERIRGVLHQQSRDPSSETH